MADRNNHYEAAFEAYLRALRLPLHSLGGKPAQSACRRIDHQEFRLYRHRARQQFLADRRQGTAISRRSEESHLLETMVRFRRPDRDADLGNIVRPGVSGTVCFRLSNGRMQIACAAGKAVPVPQAAVRFHRSSLCRIPAGSPSDLAALEHLLDAFPPVPPTRPAF